VDLLAVRRVSRGRRLGQKLVLAACQDAARHNVSVARAAIRVDNVASQRTFENAGFATDRRVHQLLLWTPRFSDSPDVCPKDVTLLPVDTVTYRGLWIEGLTSAGLGAELQRDVVRTARWVAAREERLNTGTLVPADEAHLLAADLRNQASVHGEYYWFVKKSCEGVKS
jgi:hypothetical protein